MHQITGFYFFDKQGRRFVVYSTKYASGRWASFHECTGMTDEQARGAFVLEHSREVDLLMKQKQKNENTQKIIV